jgi:hypothetical protein
MLPAILGGMAVSAGGSLFGNLLGKATAGPGFQPSPTMSALGGYGLSMLDVPKWKKKADKAQFRQYVESGDRGAGEDFYRMMAEMYPNEKAYSKGLRRSLQKPVDFAGQSSWNIADQIYANAGLPLNQQDFTSLSEKAKSAGMRSSSEFGDFLKQNLLAQGKIMSPQQESHSYIFGPPKRITEGEFAGRYTNDYMWNR